MKTTLLLIRHGITAWNQKKRYCGSTDIGLSAEGRRQARLLRARFKEACFERVYVSSKKRAQQTARIAFRGARFVTVKGIREAHFGIFEGLSYGEIMERHADLYRAWLKDPYAARIPKAETLAAFVKRVRASIVAIAARHPGGTVPVVCHGGTIGVFLCSIIGKKDFWKLVPKASSVTVVEYGRGRMKLKWFNDTSHLE